MAEVRVQVLVHVEDEPGEIGGKAVTQDEHAAWDAASAVSLVAGQDTQDRIDDGGYPLTIATSHVTSLRRVNLGREVQHDWYKTKAAVRG